MEELGEENLGGNLLRIQLTYLRKLYSQMPEDLELSLPIEIPGGRSAHHGAVLRHVSVFCALFV